MDLSIIIEEDGKRDHQDLILEKISDAIKFGYKKFALDVRISSKCIPNNIPEPPFIKIDKIKNFEYYTRLTAKIDDSLQMHKLSKSEIQLKYDILAIQTNDEKVFSQFCGGTINCDIISFDLTNPKLCFLLRKANLNLPIEKGILFEICYNYMLNSQALRINSISNARLLIDKCHQKNILISSGSKYKLNIRNPTDVANLGHIFGLKRDISKQSTFAMGLKAIKHSKIRKMPINSVIEIDNSDLWLKNELITENENLENSDNNFLKKNTNKQKRKLIEETQKSNFKKNKM